MTKLLIDLKSIYLRFWCCSMSRSIENRTRQMVSLNVLYGLNGTDC